MNPLKESRFFFYKRGIFIRCVRSLVLPFFLISISQKSHPSFRFRFRFCIRFRFRPSPFPLSIQLTVCLRCISITPLQATRINYDLPSVLYPGERDRVARICFRSSAGCRNTTWIGFIAISFARSRSALLSYPSPWLMVRCHCPYPSSAQPRTGHTRENYLKALN